MEYRQSPADGSQCACGAVLLCSQLLLVLATVLEHTITERILQTWILWRDAVGQSRTAVKAKWSATVTDTLGLNVTENIVPDPLNNAVFW
jgi:hypothetical protein